MTKKIAVFFVLIWTMISCNAEDITHIYPQQREETFVSFKIPYPQREGQKKYFQADVDYVLLVESLEIDGVPVQVKADNKCYLSLVRKYKCKKIKKNENPYVDMKWDIVGQNGDFLKEALRHADKKMPYRGPEIYQSGEFTYKCGVTGDFNWFQGFEEIYLNETKVYECVFHGGTLK